MNNNTSAPSIDHGRRVANAILAWAATDGFASFNNCPYVPHTRTRPLGADAARFP
jgi:hypothetical protein